MTYHFVEGQLILIQFGSDENLEGDFDIINSARPSVYIQFQNTANK